MTKNILKKFYRSHRIGTSVGKTLLWIWLRRDLPKIYGEIGIDLAGGSMGNKRFFVTQTYMSVDINQEKLDTGKSKNIDALIQNSDIETYLQNETKKADVLLCVQTMGTNEYFQHNKTEKVVKLMYHFLKPGGSMFFNIGSSVGDLDKLKTELFFYLRGKFEKVEFKSYGALHITKKNPLNPIIRLILAYLMDIVPPLRTFFGTRNRKVYFCCLKKNKEFT